MVDHPPLAVITGATQGIGHAVACALARQGAQIVAIGRDVATLEALDDTLRSLGGLPAVLVQMDLTAPRLKDELRIVAQSLAQRFGRIDSLIHCAGTMLGLMPVTQLPLSGFQRHLTLTVTAPLQLLQAFDPLLRAAPRGRAVFTTYASVPGEAYWGALGTATAGLHALVESYNAESGHTTVRALCVDPGPTATVSYGKAFPGIGAETLQSPDAAAASILNAMVCEDDGAAGED